MEDEILDEVDFFSTTLPPPGPFKFDKTMIILATVTLISLCIVGFSCYIRRRERVVYLCKGQIEPGDTVYRCRDCEAKPKVYLCSSCFEASIHVNCQNYEEFTASRNQKYRCHCGLRDSWCHQIGLDRMCKDHRTNIQAKIESSCKFLEIKGMKVPISPDGIPMVNLARPINENQSTPNSPESTDQSDQKTIRTGGMTTSKFLTPNLPKIAGDKYRPAAWIPYKKYENDTCEVDSDFSTPYSRSHKSANRREKEKLIL